MDKIVDSCKFTVESLNENKYFIGFTMILLNIGARFIIDELGDDVRSLISNKIVRRFFIFCSFFMATRDVLKATVLTIIFVIIINEILVEEGDEGDEEGDKTGKSYTKVELEQAIQKLKGIQSTM